MSILKRLIDTMTAHINLPVYKRDVTEYRDDCPACARNNVMHRNYVGDVWCKTDIRPRPDGKGLRITMDIDHPPVDASNAEQIRGLIHLFWHVIVTSIYTHTPTHDKDRP